jgi:tryptophan-rich sensory protein
MANAFAAAAGSPLPAFLLLPYLAWLVFATALNIRLWQFNGPTA